MKTEQTRVLKQWFTISESAEYLGVSQDTLRRWEKKGKLIPRRTVGKHRRYSKKQLENILKQPIEQVILHKPKEKIVQEPEHKTLTKDKPVYQTTVQATNYPLPQTQPVPQTKRQFPKISKSAAITALIVATIVSLLAASFILLQVIKNNQQAEKPLSPIPNSRERLLK